MLSEGIDEQVYRRMRTHHRHGQFALKPFCFANHEHRSCAKRAEYKINSRLGKSITCSFQDAQCSAGFLSKTDDFVTNRWSTAMVKNFSRGVGQLVRRDRRTSLSSHAHTSSPSLVCTGTTLSLGFTCRKLVCPGTGQRCPSDLHAGSWFVPHPTDDHYITI